jgi:hypothetical protein
MRKLGFLKIQKTIQKKLPLRTITRVLLAHSTPRFGICNTYLVNFVNNYGKTSIRFSYFIGIDEHYPVVLQKKRDSHRTISFFSSFFGF